MSDTICKGTDGPAGEAWPGLLPLRECPACRGMFHPTRAERMPKHPPATAVEVLSLERSKANLLYIVFCQGQNWATIAPVIHADLAAARADAAGREGATITGFPKAQAHRFARPA